MSTFASTVAASVEGYITLRRALGYQFRKQAALLHAFVYYLRSAHIRGP